MTSLTIALALATATSAIAASTADAFRVTLLPQSVPAGGHSTLRATIQATVSRVDSLTLRPPEGYGVVAVEAPPGVRAAVRRNVVRLRGLAIAPGTSKAVALSVDAPCSSRTRRPWRTHSKQDRRFTTQTTGHCELEFIPQPASARIGQRITAASFDPAGHAPAVAVIDARGQRSQSDGVKVALTLAPGSGAGPLNGGERRASRHGVVAFPALRLGTQGIYRLVASAKRVPQATSERFTAEQDAVACADNVACSGSATASGTIGPDGRPYTVRVDVSAPDNPDLAKDGGTLRTSFNTEPPLDCRGYDERAPDTAVFLGLNREKIVRLTFSASLAIDPATLQACVGLPYNFMARLLTRFPIQEDTDGDGRPDQFVGQLNDCLTLVLGLLITPPCVAERATDARGDAFITIRLPASGSDPRFRS